MAEKPKILHLRRGTKIDRELTRWPAYPGVGYEARTNSHALKQAQDRAKVGMPIPTGGHWFMRPWAEDDGTLLCDMFIVLPPAMYQKYSEPEVNEFGEVSP